MKIADFGVSSNLRSDFAPVSKYTGTIHYMSPERIEDKSYFFDADLWSLGMLLVEAANGRYPFLHLIKDAKSVKDLTFWDLKSCLTNCAIPKLDEKLKFSIEFHDFTQICLRREGGTRSTA